MIKTSYLRVYQPLWAFSAQERDAWLARPGEGEPLDQSLSRRWLITAALPPAEAVAVSETAFVKHVDGESYLCPWRTRLRMLAGLVAFCDAVPQEVADAFVPAIAAQRAARELASLEQAQAEPRSHILHANWHVPLRWFVAFDAADRILVEDRYGLRIRYETELQTASARAHRALSILEDSGMDDGVTSAVAELCEWLDRFSGGGLLELDYASVAEMFDHDALVDDYSAEQVSGCLDALETGDVLRAGRLFSELVERWSEPRVREVVN